jgi:hypothetical protein
MKQALPVLEVIQQRIGDGQPHRGQRFRNQSDDPSPCGADP